MQSTSVFDVHVTKKDKPIYMYARLFGSFGNSCDMSFIFIINKTTLVCTCIKKLVQSGSSIEKLHVHITIKKKSNSSIIQNIQY